MNGGMAFIASGADTCVYDPPVGCDPPPDPPFDLQNKVSRIVTYESGELKNQVLLEQLLIKIESVFPEIRKYVNLNTDACIPKFKPEDKEGSCKIAALKQSNVLVNLITPKQGKDLSDYYKTSETKSKLFSDHMMKLTVAMSYINEYGMIHTDLHGKNISMLDGRLIAHDWGRAFISKNKDDYNINVFYTLKNIKVFEKRADTKYVLPVMTNTGYFNNVVDPRNQKEKVDSVLKRSWDTLALIGVSEKYEIITKESVNKFLTAFVELVKKGPIDENFSSNLRKIIPLAFGQMKEVLNSVKQIGFASVSRRSNEHFEMKKDLLQSVLNQSYGSKDEHSERFKCGRNARVITQRRK
jgi:hypothetical protein